jgi:hypothetical protein
MGLHEIKKICTTREMVCKLKRPPTAWRKYIRQKTDNQNIQGAQKTNPLKNQ